MSYGVLSSSSSVQCSIRMYLSCHIICSASNTEPCSVTSSIGSYTTPSLSLSRYITWSSFSQCMWPNQIAPERRGSNSFLSPVHHQHSTVTPRFPFNPLLILPPGSHTPSSSVQLRLRHEQNQLWLHQKLNGSLLGLHHKLNYDYDCTTNLVAYT